MRPLVNSSSRCSHFFRLFAGASLLYAGMVHGVPADSIGSVSSEAAWKRGVHLIRTGEILTGIRLLDSLRVSGYSGNDFLKDYCLTVFHALVPEKVDTEPRIASNFIGTVLDTLDPVSHEWNVTRFYNHQEKMTLPCFTYGATFEMRKPFHLVFTGFRRSNLTLLQIGYLGNPSPYNSISRQLEDRNARASCKLFIDLNAAGSPSIDYISKRINGVYDSIAVKPELQARRGLSLRCYTASRYANEDGKFTAIASFDRTISDLRRQSGPMPAAQRPGIIRYTLVVESSSDVNDLLEAKFQSLLRAFL
jgi:hypothetical protein